jgi:hypothetical protein
MFVGLDGLTIAGLGKRLSSDQVAELVGLVAKGFCEDSVGLTDIAIAHETTTLLLVGNGTPAGLRGSSGQLQD